VQALAAYPEAEVLVVPHRGKIASLNQAREQVKTFYALITDADIVLSEKSLRYAVRQAEADPQIGLVGGIRYVLPERYRMGVAVNEAVYLGYEQKIALAESEWGYALGVGGGFLLVKKPYWTAMPPGVADDLYFNLEVGLRGGKSVLEPEARGYELPSATVKEEYKRKVRIAYNAFHTLAHRFSWREALRVPMFAFFFLSHKVSRYIIAPVAVIMLTGVSVILTIQLTSPVYSAVCGLLVFAWLQGYLIWKIPALRLPKLLSLPGYFILAHMAQLAGLWKFLRGEDPLKVWQRLPRTELQPSRP